MKNYSKVLTIVLIVIIIAILVLVGFLVVNTISNSNINKQNEEMVDTISGIGVGTLDNGTISTNTLPIENTIIDDTNTVDTNATTDTNTSTSARTRKQLNGFDVLGTIQIPKINLKYAVLDKNTKKSLETAVAVVWPQDAILNTVGNIVISGHNYRNGMFFSNLKKLSKGDKIYITDEFGNKVTYSIYDIFEATPEDATFYNRDTDGKREITLSTCTDDSSARTIVLAREE